MAISIVVIFAVLIFPVFGSVLLTISRLIPNSVNMSSILALDAMPFCPAFSPSNNTLSIVTLSNWLPLPWLLATSLCLSVNSVPLFLLLLLLLLLLLQAQSLLRVMVNAGSLIWRVGSILPILLPFVWTPARWIF